MTATSEATEPTWASLADQLGSPHAAGAFSDFPDLFLTAGRYYSYGQWRDGEHRLSVRLHRWGIGGSQEPVGMATCDCEHWHEENWRTGRTPRLLPYQDLAAWIGEHAAATEAPEVVQLMNGARLLAALNS